MQFSPFILFNTWSVCVSRKLSTITIPHWEEKKYCIPIYFFTMWIDGKHLHTENINHSKKKIKGTLFCYIVLFKWSLFFLAVYVLNFYGLTHFCNSYSFLRVKPDGTEDTAACDYTPGQLVVSWKHEASRNEPFLETLGWSIMMHNKASSHHQQSTCRSKDSCTYHSLSNGSANLLPLGCSSEKRLTILIVIHHVYT